MLSSVRARFVYVLSMLAAYLVVLGLVVVVLQQALVAGTAEAWAMAGVLAVVVGVPLMLLLLPVASWLKHRLQAPVIVPDMGDNVPGLGQ